MESEEVAGRREEAVLRSRVTSELTHPLLSPPIPRFLPVQDEIEQVILVGGATRVPKVQEVLLKAVGK